jgi:hypothetical protein
MGYVPMRQRIADKSLSALGLKGLELTAPAASRFAAVPNEDFSQATTALYEREVARGVSENEEIFAGEEEIPTSSKPIWASKLRPRKPRYFNRVQMGYEWNKYNQTHYDHDNPPPKVVQGYKFNIFYPDLIDKTKGPTYRIERENGRKRGQSFTPAGEEDTCLIRFLSGPPYEDLAFRIVDKEWDYSAKRERGFRSSFDKVRQSIILLSILFFALDRITGAKTGSIRNSHANNLRFRVSCSCIFNSRRYFIHKGFDRIAQIDSLSSRSTIESDGRFLSCTGISVDISAKHAALSTQPWCNQGGE